MDVVATAHQIHRAHQQSRCLPATDVEVGDLASAYLVQAALTELRRSNGATRIGWKLGYTSRAMRDQMGVLEPNFGPLLSSMVLEDAGAVAHGLIHPRVEPEVALVLGATVGPGAGTEEVLDRCRSAHAALEVVDSVWCGYEFDLAHNTADGSSAAHVVLGPPIPLESLADVEVALYADGVVAGRGRGRDAAGHPAAAVAWLAEALAAGGRGLGAGDVIITGGLTAAVPLEPGGSVHAEFRPPGLGPLLVGVTR